ncbi:hypothetical protein [Phytopseudomonas dryadis]|uniref:Uncharacterized protein n=1 Tax=Phytopseudomonas dryadis TaxID=2487520 RepID=A0A4Q9R0I2_9GAMM|nr:MULTISPECIES: hypothetical protein [Pseudomonas]TBU90041.1 hypothetical protein DNK44_16040 [Pseudomonas dryadis]TBV02643.1 hypothetical protein DNK34_18475 [Pseudomonas dryadis]TBV15495.1 hypothetical protein DNK41_17765 [Pseudomonas sp. FRB 230]
MSVVVVSERDEQHMSHEAQAMGKRVWDVHQNDQLVGIFPSREEAIAYQAELETSASPHTE